MAARERTALPDDQNSAVVVRRVRTLAPKEWIDWAEKSIRREQLPAPLNRWQRLEDVAGNNELIGATREARDLGITLYTMPHGYHVVEQTDGPFLFDLKETEGARQVAYLLKTDATLAAQGNDPVRGLRAAHAVLNTARSIGDETVLSSSFTRATCGMMAAETVMRVLAQTDPKNALAELTALQAALAAEVDEPIMLNGLRGERARTNQFLNGLASGRLGATDLRHANNERTAPEHRAYFYFRRAFLPGDQARFLRATSAFIEVMKRPAREALAGARQIEDDLNASRSVWYPFHSLLILFSVGIIEYNLWHRAELLSATVLIACERFRLARGRWPESLAELPKELLPTIPSDPYDRAPIKFAKLADGIAVYAIGVEPSLARERKRLSNPLGGTEVGWRLYDLSVRGLPPLPPKEPTEDNGQP